jgi:hypothetical protein
VIIYTPFTPLPRLGTMDVADNAVVNMYFLTAIGVHRA